MPVNIDFYGRTHDILSVISTHLIWKGTRHRKKIQIYKSNPSTLYSLTHTDIQTHKSSGSKKEADRQICRQTYRITRESS